jgi:hypothetical protein
MTGDEMLEELGVDENGAVEIEVEIGGRTVKLVPVSPVRFEHSEKRIVIPAEVAS